MITARGRLSVDGVWVVVMAATVLTTWGLPASGLDTTVTTVGVVVIAAWKVHLIMMRYMELACTGWITRLLVDVWILAVAGIIVGFYLGALSR